MSEQLKTEVEELAKELSILTGPVRQFPGTWEYYCESDRNVFRREATKLIKLGYRKPPADAKFPTVEELEKICRHEVRVDPKYWCKFAAIKCKEAYDAELRRVGVI